MRLDAGQIEVIDDAMAEVLKRKLPAERIKIGFTLRISAQKMLTHHLQKTHPDWDEKTVERGVAGRFLNGTEIWEAIVKRLDGSNSAKSG